MQLMSRCLPIGRPLWMQMNATPWLPGVKTGPTVPAGASAIPMDEMMKKLVGAQTPLATTLNLKAFGIAVATAIDTVNPATIGTQVGLGVENAITGTLIPVPQAGIPTQAMHTPETSGVAGIT
jgi:hypothetical protein